jgi:hypothetical protein
MRIIGLDVGRGSAVLCCLESFPSNIKRTYKELKATKQFYKLATDTSGVDKLINLNPDGIVLEPTGQWYSHFWVRVAKVHNIAIYWISHTDLDKQRGWYGFPNKRDEEDAFCLAASFFDPNFINEHGQKRFLDYYYNQEIITQVRETFLEKEQLQKLRSAMVSQLRQRLAYEFPEIVKTVANVSSFHGFTPFIGWLAGIHPSTRYENKYRLSVGHSLNIIISDYTRSHALMITTIEQRISERLSWFESILNEPQFKPYFTVFDRFGFGLDNKMLLLYHCYPFEKFLVNGKPWIEREENHQGKLQKRDRSLRKFQAYLGLSYSYRQSGEKKSRKFHGSKIMRSHLYVWAVCMVAPSNYRIKSDIGIQLCDRYIELRTTVKGKDALIRILFKATRMLFYELLNELVR